MQILRDYQERGLAQILDAYRAGARAVLAVSPVGSGKTTIFGTLASQVSPSVILVHRRELATQAATRLREFGASFGYIMAGEPIRPNAPIQIASVPTLIRRNAPRARLVICDEAHLSTARTWQAVLANYPNAKILGFTATPWRLSGKPLVGAYDACVVISTPRELCDQGWLCPYVGFSYKTPDLSDVKTTGGDYNEAQSAEAMRAPTIVDNVVEEWGKHARELSTVVFAVTVEHSKELTARFKAAGIQAEHLDGETPRERRAAILKRVEHGLTRVLCNVGVAVEGLDIPRLKCCVLARPTKSLSRQIQMCGRVRRPWQGQTARIHDHAFNIRLHGLPDEDRDYTLNAKPEAPPSLTTCDECLALYTGPRCPACAHENEVKPQGERQLITVPDAEQFTFGSEDEAQAVYQPPIDARWDRPGRVIKGRYVRRWTEDTSFGFMKTYLVHGAERNYRFHGTTHLNALMERVPLESVVRITYLEERLIPGGRTKKIFKVEIDDGT